MERILISLISRQPMPNYIPVRMLQPNKVIALYTSEEWNTLQNLKQALPEVPFLGTLVKAYSYDSVVHALRTILEQPADAQWILNVTGGTKIMALASVLEFRNRFHHIVYVNTEENLLLYLNQTPVATKPLPEVVDIPTYLLLHGQRIQKEKSRQAHNPFANWNGDTMQLINLISTLSATGAEKTLQLPQPLSEAVQGFLKRLAGNRANAIPYDPIQNRLTISDPRVYQYLKGPWLEDYLTVRIKTLKPADLRQNVKLQWREASGSPKNEFDLVAIFHNRLFLFECKSGPLDQEDITKISTLREIVGGTFARAFLVTQHKATAAMRRRIAEIPNLDLIDGDHILHPERVVMKFLG